MATINSLMKHLRTNGVRISGSTQKRKLRRIGYYHGYKGYRFAGKSGNRLDITDFNEIVALHDFDMGLKSLFYGHLMSVETALKNRVLEETLPHSRSERFEDVYRTCLTAYKCHKGKDYTAAWSSRLKLRTEIDHLIARDHNTKAVIKHFRDSDRDIPIWALFEAMTLGNFGSFYNCLHEDIKASIRQNLDMPLSNFDSPLALKKIIFAFKDLRNAVAHNGIILDTRFKTAEVHKSVSSLLKFEMNVEGVQFKEITDYVLLIIFLMTKLEFTKTECKQLLQGYKEIVEKYRGMLPYSIYSQFVGTQTRAKLQSAMDFIRNS